jgi:hypothetical protein
MHSSTSYQDVTRQYLQNLLDTTSDSLEDVLDGQQIEFQETSVQCVWQLSDDLPDIFVHGYRESGMFQFDIRIGDSSNTPEGFSVPDQESIMSVACRFVSYLQHRIDAPLN